jgi:hypothetical protein
MSRKVGDEELGRTERAAYITIFTMDIDRVFIGPSTPRQLFFVFESIRQELEEIPLENGQSSIIVYENQPSDGP